MNTRLISIIRKEFIQLYRDKRMLALILVLPLVQMFLLGYAFNNELRDVPMAVFDQSHSVEAEPCWTPSSSPITSSWSTWSVRTQRCKN